MTLVARACLTCGWPTTHTRCPDCERTHRGTTIQRGYGTQHQAERVRWSIPILTGQIRCARCGEFIQPGSEWDLGHDDHDRRVYTGPEHVACNRSTTSR